MTALSHQKGPMRSDWHVPKDIAIPIEEWIVERKGYGYTLILAHLAEVTSNKGDIRRSGKSLKPEHTSYH